MGNHQSRSPTKFLSGVNSGLTAVEVAQFKKEFKALDTDNSGTISRAEFKAKYGGCAEFSDNWFKFFTALDKDRSGQLSFDEYLLLCAWRTGRLNKKDQRILMFCAIDSSGDGFISIKELSDFLDNALYLYDQLSIEEIKRIISKRDVNGDSVLSYQEAGELLDAIATFSNS